MTAYTDRADALEAAIRDIARDLEADLEKLTRFRGSSSPATKGITFKDPGPTLATYEKQKEAAPGRVQFTINSYAAALSGARDAAGGGELASPEDRIRRVELVQLIAQVSAVASLEDAAALIASFETEA